MWLREPSAYEIKTMTNLGICYGAKGIMYYIYAMPHIWLTGLQAGEGMLDNISPQIPTPRYIDDHDYPKWETVKQLNYKLAAIGDELMSLTWQKAYSIHLTGQPSQDYITNVQSFYGLEQDSWIPDLPASTYIELGLFKKSDESTNQNIEHFFVVNRRTLPLDSRKIRVDIDKTSTNPGNYQNWRVKEVGTSNEWTIGPSGYFEIMYEPGEGKLFRLEPVILGGGTLVYNETLPPGTNINVKGTVTVGQNATLTIGHSSTLNFLNGSSLSVKGQLNVNGTYPNFVTLNFQQPNDNGIKIKSGGAAIIKHTNIQNASTGIETESGINNLKVYYSNFTGCTDYGVNILGSASSVPHINYCQITGSQTGINASGVNSVVIKQNGIHNTQMGISVMQVLGEAHIINNTISSSLHLLHGILANSSAGYIRGNTITGHSIGITFLNSSLLVGGNFITDQLVNGLFVTSGSQPDLKARVVQIPGCNPPMYYALSGFNNIYDNGGYEATWLANDDGSEIYINNSYILMDIGCNTISDNRIAYPLGSPPDPRTTINLMNGRLVDVEKIIRARYNCWGEHPVYALEERFGNLIVEYDPVVSNCIIPESPIGCPLIIYDFDDNEIDTIYAAAELIDEETEIEAFYSQGESLYSAGEYNQAVIIYNQIINLYGNEPESGGAYLRLYQIEKARQSDTTVFAQLKNFYDGKLPDIEDDVLYKIVSQLSALCLVAEREYIPAMDVFANIILNYPDTDEALSAELDALTTSLIAGYNGNQMGKYSASGLAAKDSKEYNSKIKQLIWNKYGVENQGSGKEPLIPEDYLLYQNYPNPFNPTTTVRYDLPKPSIVELTIFDILGRKVKTLVNNEMKQAGRYEVSFNASSLPSGVYFYRITAGDYVSTKKMLLVK